MPVHVPWTGDPIPPPPAVDPNDTAHLLTHIKMFQKDPLPSDPYNQIMDAGFDPNTQVISQSTSLGAQEGRADYKWLLSSQDLPSGLAEQQGSAPNRHHHLPPIETLPPLPEASFQSLQSSVQYTQDLVQEVTATGGPVQAGLSELTKHYIQEASANLKAIRAAKTPNCLPQETRRIIREMVEERVFQPAPRASPEVIFVCSSTANPCDVVVPLSRPASVASMWSHVARETNDTGYTQNFQTMFLEIHIQDFIESINDALCAPVLTELRNLLEEPGWVDEEGVVKCIKSKLMVELGRNVSESQTGYAHFYLAAPLQLHKDNDYPCLNEGFNLSAALVIAALDSGVEDNRSDLEQAGMIPSSWFRLASAIIGTITQGTLRSGGHDWRVGEGIVAPVTQGGRIAAQAQQLANFFIHYAGSDEPPLAEFYDSVLQQQRIKFQSPTYKEWKGLYKHALVQALEDREEDREESPDRTDPLLKENAGYIKLFVYNCAKEIRKSIAREEIKAACRETRAQISLEKKVWAVAFHNSNKLAWLTKAAEDMGFVLVSKDDAEEHEGHMAKTPHWPFCVPATPENCLRKLDNSQTPKARKTKGKRSVANPCPTWSRSNSISSQPSDLSDVPDVDMAEIKHPLFFASSYLETVAALQAVVGRNSDVAARITGISVPQAVQPSQAPEAPLRNPKATLLELETDVSVCAASRQLSLAPDTAHSTVNPTPPSRVLTLDSTRGVASLMHNPENAMADDLPTPAQEVVAVPPALPSLQPIPLLPGLAKMLNALQANLMTCAGQAYQDLTPEREEGQGNPARPDPSLHRICVPQPSNSEALPVPDPLPVLHPPPPSAAPRPPHAILPDKTTWAGVVTPLNFAQNSTAKAQAGANANSIGRTPRGAVHKGRGANPTSVENTEITITQGEGLADKTAKAGLYKFNPGNIVQAAQSIVPFQTIPQFTKALVEPLGVGNPLPNKGWTFAQLRGVPTSDRARVIHSPETLLQEIRRVPFFQDTIFISKPHWQLPVTSLAHVTRGVVQLAFIDELGMRSRTVKAQGVGMFGSCTQFYLTGNKPYFAQCGQCHEIGHATNAPAWGKTTGSIASADLDGFTTVGKNGKDSVPPAKLSKSAKQRGASAQSGLPMAGPSNPNTNGDNQGSTVSTVLFPEDVATITETIDAFRKLAYAVCNGLRDDLQHAMTELEGGWGVPTEHLDNLFSLPARYTVKGLFGARVAARQPSQKKFLCLCLLSGENVLFSARCLTKIATTFPAATQPTKDTGETRFFS
ncbi:hypothetical protein BJY52DRAFT_1418514 [Lactarius psammicola]|nr:hypothetical protein BJY52DRAFT_1418514 [Lactarius psammicola]